MTSEPLLASILFVVLQAESTSKPRMTVPVWKARVTRRFSGFAHGR